MTLRTAQAAMRHSDPSLTANVYTDPRLLDVSGAVNSLPGLPLDDSASAERVKITGTFDTGSACATVAPTVSNCRQLLAKADKAGNPATGNTMLPRTAVSAEPVSSKQGRINADNGGETGRYWTRTAYRNDL